MRIFGLIGYPLSHSFSERYFAEKFERQQISDAVYRNFELADITGIHAIIQSNPELVGLNVTIPHKQTIIPFLTELSSEANEIGAVNCIRIKGEQLIGHNTDAYGFEMSIKPFIENNYERALILGTGGASKAIAYVLKKWGIQFFHVTRNPHAPNHISYSELNAESIRHFPLIVNTTPLGTSPDILTKPDLPYSALTPAHFCYDLVYNPAQTAFMTAAAAQGAKVMNGLKMLELQAEKSWQIWNQD